MSIVSSNLQSAIDYLMNEDLVAIPTETVYGLAGNIFSEKAILKIFEVKQRPMFNPLIVHVSSSDKVHDLVQEFPENAKKLASAFWPGSLTLILKKRPTIPDIITAGKDSVAIRVPDHPVTLELLTNLPFPLAAPSANPFGSISPTSAAHVEDYFYNQIPMVLEGGECKNGIESTIVGFENGEPIVYRLGSISIEQLEAVIGKVQIKNKKEIAPNAPGMLSRHYAPKTKTYLVDDIHSFVRDFTDLRIGVLVFSKDISSETFSAVEILSREGDMNQAASRLYSALHDLDKLDLDLIVAERFPDVGLGKSINDRLERATKDK